MGLLNWIFKLIFLYKFLLPVKKRLFLSTASTCFLGKKVTAK